MAQMAQRVSSAQRPFLGGLGQLPLRSSVACRATKRARRQRNEGDDEYASWRAARRRALLQYARECQANEVQAWIEQAPPSAVSAMKLTVSNLVGTLPPQHFSVTIDTVAESLATLMETMLRTGYLLRGAHYQLELETALKGAAASMSSPAASTATVSSSVSSRTADTASSPAAALSGGSVVAAEVVSGSAAVLPAQLWAHPEDGYAPGVQLSKVQGEVLRWHNTHGLDKVPAQQYIQSLEEQVRALQLQLQQQQQVIQQLQARGAAGGMVAGPAPAAPVASNPAAAHPVALNYGPSVGSEIMGANNTPALAAAAATAAAAAAGCSIAAASDGGFPDVLSYVRGLDSTALSALGACGTDVSEAMQFFMERLMGPGSGDKEYLRTMTSTFDVVELSKLLFWLLVVGWSLRSLEVRYDVEESFGGSLGDKDDGKDSWMLPGW